VDDAATPEGEDRRIVLARQAPFRLGRVTVRPATREIAGPAGRAILQPRVMQVLVALARADSQILTRDDLAESCWEGRIVGEDALSRIISKLRRVGEGVGRDGWTLETIPRVGYRLVPAGHDADAALPPAAGSGATPRIGRRGLIAGGGLVLAAAVAGGVAWLRTPKVPKQAQVLYQKGLEALKPGLQADNAQAQGFLREAVALAPDYAAAWGALALAYQGALLYTAPPRQAGVRAQAEAAARRALELDPNEPQAAAALALLAQSWRNWTAVEKLYERALSLHARDPQVEFVYARLLLETGRLKASVPLAESSVKGDEFAVWHHHTLGCCLWAAGRLEETEQALAKALARWPRHYALWFLQLAMLTYSGRADQAVAMGDDLANRPINIPFEDVELNVMCARALAGRGAAELRRVADAQLAAAKRGIGYAENAMSYLSAAGFLDEAFGVASAIYLGEDLARMGARFATGTFIVGKRRQTHHLFMPPTAAMRADPRFPRLMQDIGLADYWRASGHAPDDPRWMPAHA
jgi:DNA-binding winged helix-turn-helix (wHTH) protein/Tfp pilus assembly protein PilF